MLFQVIKHALFFHLVIHFTFKEKAISEKYHQNIFIYKIFYLIIIFIFKLLFYFFYHKTFLYFMLYCYNAQNLKILS